MRQAAEGELVHAAIGPVAKATAIYLRYDLGLPYRKIQRLFTDLLDPRFVPASALGFDRQAARKGLPLYDDVRAKLRALPVVHVDETGWRVDGINHFLWYAGHDRLAYFHIDRHRSGAVAQAILGDSFDGVLIADDYAAYGAVHARARQSCLAHPLRAARDLLEPLQLLRAEGVPHADAERFAKQLSALLKEACEAGRQLRAGERSPRTVARLEAGWLRRLDQLSRRRLHYEPAETLRPSVILRKITFGNRPASGAQNHSVLTGLLQTARRQGVELRKFLRTLFLSDTATAQAALYNNSS